MGKKKSQEEAVQDSAGTFYQFVVTNTPYYGTLLKATDGSILNANYYRTNIVVASSTDKVPNHANTMLLKDKLGAAATLTGIMSFIATGAGVMQANELFYIDDMGKIVKNNSSFARLGVDATREISNVSKGFGTAFSYIGTGFTVGQAVVTGFDGNSKAELLVCTIGYVPGIGWVISGIYNITNTAVTIATGKTIPDHIYTPTFDLYARFCNELKAKMFGWYNIPFTFR